MEQPVSPIVLHVIETLGRGGAEACLVAGLPSLRHAGWDARVLALNGPYDLAPALLERGVPVFCGRRGALKLALESERGRPAIVHTHLYRANILGRIGALLFRVPMITTLHNPDYGAEGPGWMGMRRTLDRWTFYFTPPRFIAVSQAVLDDYQEQMGYTAVVIPNPIDSFWLMGTMPTRDEARVALGLSGQRALVFSAGRLHNQKGFDTLAEAASLLPDVDFVVAGQGPQRDLLDRAGTLRLVGVQPREVIRQWIAAADVVAVPSRYESFGIFAAEAMACGRALIAADVPGLRTTVAGAALLVRPERPADLADAIRQLISNQDLRRELEAKAPALAARFAPQAWASRLSEIYTSVSRLSQARRP
jgi:glycosyltransferase involved in cell wall biosynthesis